VTDDQCRPIVDPLGDDLSELLERLSGRTRAVQAARGYPASGPHDLARLGQAS
jgi:hypothetical protein